MKINIEAGTKWADLLFFFLRCDSLGFLGKYRVHLYIITLNFVK